MPEVIGAAVQLERIFYILPRAAREGGDDLLAWCPQSEEVWTFRLDRVLEPEEVRGWVRGAVGALP